MEEKTTKRPRRVMVSEGKLLIMTEVPFKEGNLVQQCVSLALLMVMLQRLP